MKKITSLSPYVFDGVLSVSPSVVISSNWWTAHAERAQREDINTGL